MRKALLVIALIAASFAGGAVVNGPGLAWVRRTIGLSPLFVDQGSEVQDPARVSQAAPDLSGETPVGEARVSPTSPNPPGLEQGRNGHRSSTPRPKAQGSSTAALEPRGRAPSSARSDAMSPPALEPPAGARVVDTHGWGDAKGSAPARAFLPTPGSYAPGERAQRDNAVARANGSTEASSPRDQTQPAVPKKSGSSDSDAHPQIEPGRQSTQTWSEISKRMKALGVVHYCLEGEPGELVRFRCVVPLVGQDAVSQQFETQGDDVVSTADTALRRIALWRATERP